MTFSIERIIDQIQAAKRCCADAELNAWADAWLNGTDRSEKAAHIALNRASANAYADFLLPENQSWCFPSPTEQGFNAFGTAADWARYYAASQNS